jgi:DNA polymerase-3 subunit delta'
MVMAGTHPAVTLVATDKAIISIDEVRGLIASAARTPSSGRYRIIVVEDADRMVEKTTNVLLKSIEEPPAHTVWILCAPTAGDVLPTIRSRCRPVVLRVPAPQAVADLIVRRDGVDAAVALAAAQAAQSHVGLARRLARDPDARRRRADILALPLQVRGVGDAVIAADRLVSIAKKESESATVERDTEEKAQLLRALGVEPGASVPPRLRSQVKNLEDDQKRRATRRQRDMLDRAMLDLLSLYRDVLLIQMGAGANHPIDLVNGADPTLDRHIRALAAATTPQSTLERMDAIGQARQRVQQNVPPLLACEAMMVALR